MVISGSGTDFDPGWWKVVVEDPESGIAELQIKVNGYIIVEELNFNSQFVTLIDCPASTYIL